MFPNELIINFNMKTLIVICAVALFSCEDDNLEIYCISGVNQNGDRVTLNCAIKERVDATIEANPGYTDYQSRLVDSCGECPL